MAGALRVTVTDPQAVPLEHAVVIAIPLAGKARSARPPAPQVVDQVNKEFVPFVKAIQTRTSVVFPNRDNLRHHVYSFSPAKKFELPLYAGVPANPVVFDQAGVVVLGCNIHDWMLGYLYVTDSPYHGTTAKDGVVQLDGLDPGEYEVRGWHPGLVDPGLAPVKQLQLEDARPAAVSLELAVKPMLRAKRAPSQGGARYR